MTDAERLKEAQAFIGRQALKIAKLETQVSTARGIAARINLIMICVGGPLNDNRLRYTPEQMRDFLDIQELLEPLMGMSD